MISIYALFSCELGKNYVEHILQVCQCYKSKWYFRDVNMTQETDKHLNL